MKQIIRAIGYTGSLQTLTMPVGYKGNVTAYLWGGGGGGGGNDSRVGGTGGGGGFSRITFNAQSGQVITVAVGGGGGGGGRIIPARPVDGEVMAARGQFAADHAEGHGHAGDEGLQIGGAFVFP